MIGEHTVTVYADRGALGWTPLGTNPNFTTDMAGWQAGPFESAWTWFGGAVSAPVPHNLNRTPAATNDRPAAGNMWRVQATVTVSARCLARGHVYFGTTRDGASKGPFWAPSESVQMFSYDAHLRPGTHDLEWTWEPVGWPPPEYVYVAPALYLAQDLGTPATVTVDRLALDYRATASPVADLTCLIDEVAIAHGRTDTTGQPDAPSATLDLTVDAANPLPPVVDIGAVVRVTTSLSSATGTVVFDRFSGRITDVAMGWDDAGEDTPNAGIVQVTAVGTLADLGRRVVGAEPFPAEPDGARVARVASLADMALDGLYSDPGTVQIRPRDVDSQPALDVMRGAAASAGGMVWQTRTGDVRYADADHRRGIQPSLDLDACDLLVTPTWTRNLDGLTNDVSIGYGVEVDGGEEGGQPRYVGTNPTSMATWGRYAFTTATELEALADATAMGLLLLTRNSRPVWILSALPIAVEDLTTAETQALLALDLHSLVTVTGLPRIGAAPVTLSGWVEGWAERLTYGGHELALVLSDYCRTSPPLQWDELDTTLTWDQAPGTWDGATCWGPPPVLNLGRWVDVAASTRWDMVPAGLTWDTWT